MFGLKKVAGGKGVLSYRLRLRWFIAMMAAMVLGVGVSGCASVADEAKNRRLKMRAEARWEALIKGDFEKAYMFSSPDYRNVVSLQQFRTRFGRTVEWRLARVDDIRYDSPTVASVMMGVTYRTYLPGAKGEPFDNRKTLTEKWLLKDGEWWYINQ